MRLAFEKKVLSWSGAAAKKMFGCPCYKVNGKLFAFLVTDGLVLTRLESHDRSRLARNIAITLFKAGNRIIKIWPRIPLISAKDMTRAVSLAKKSYVNAV